MQARLTLVAVAAAAALSLTVSAGAANNRPGDYYNGKPATSGWNAVHPDPTGWRGTKWNTVRPNPFGLRSVRPNPIGLRAIRPAASAGWTRAQV